MTAIEKMKLCDKLGKAHVKFLNNLPDGTLYADIARMILREAFAIVKFCVREGYEGCKKNSRKADKVTREYFRRIADMTREERLEELDFKDDNEEA